MQLSMCVYVYVTYLTLFFFLLFVFHLFYFISAARSTSEDQTASEQRSKDVDEPSPKDKDKDEGKQHSLPFNMLLLEIRQIIHLFVLLFIFVQIEIIKVFDGNASIRKRTSRTITISRSATKDQLIAAALRSFHIHDDPRYYVLTDVYGNLINYFCSRIIFFLSIL